MESKTTTIFSMGLVYLPTFGIMTTCWGLPNLCTMWVSFHESRSTVTDVPAFWQGPRDLNFKYPPFSYAKKDHKVLFLGTFQ